MLRFLREIHPKASPPPPSHWKNGKSWYRKKEFCLEIKKIISGKWEMPDPADPARKFMLTAAQKKKEKKFREKIWLIKITLK